MKTLLLTLGLLPVLALGQSLPPPTISHETGFYDEEFNVEITHPDSDVTILYTIDGSEPSFDNLAGKEWTYKTEYPYDSSDPLGALIKDTIWTYEYNAPLLIKNRESEPNFTSAIPTAVNTNYGASDKVFKNTIVKAVAYLNGEYSEVITRNYFVHPLGENRYSLPVFSVSIDNDKLYGYEEGLNVPGKIYDQYRVDNPGTSFDPLDPANYQAEGSSSEFQVHVSYIKEGTELVNHYAGIRLNGSWTRFYPNRAIRLYAKSGYGTSRFQVPFFEDYPYDNFKRIILRNSGNDVNITMFRDAFIHNLVKNLNFDVQQFQPVVLFLNSEYDGIRNLRSKYDSKYFERVYDVDEDEIDYLDVNGEIKEGDDIHYQEMLDFLRNNSLTDNNNYYQTLTYLDHINFTDNYITNIFVANYDWPHHNNRLWRKRVSYDSTAEYGHDGRFRWILKDTDFGFNLNIHNSNEYKINSLEWATRTIDPSEPNYTILDNSTLILRKLLENEEYKNYFLNRFADLLNTTLSTDRIILKLHEFKDVYSPEIEENSIRWSNFSPNLNTWESNIDVMLTFAMNRSSFQKNHLIQKFDLEGMYDLVLDVSDTTHGHIHLNTIDILPTTDGISNNPYIWIGNYFKNVPITLKAIEKPGYVFSHWSGEVNDTVPEITISLNQDTYIKANFIPEDALNIENYTSNKATEITVYPNPFNEYINILADSYEGNYAIYTTTGQLVKEGVLSSQKIQLDDFEKGVYLLKISSKDTFYTHRIVKE